MFAVMRLVKSLDLERDMFGTEMKVTLAVDDCQGMIPVFDTIENAEKVYGVGVECVPIQFAPGWEDNHTTATPPKREDDSEQ